MAQWAGLSHTAQWDQTKYYPRVILIGVGRFLKFGPRRMFSLDEINQLVAGGPVGHPFIPGPVGTHARVSKVKRMDQRDNSPVSSTGILGPVNQTGSHIRSDFVKISTINRLASSGGTLPSSDSGVHSLGEQCENMSTNSIDMESEQNERPTYDSTMSRRVSDTGVPPDAEEGGDLGNRTRGRQLRYSKVTGTFSLIM